MDSLLTMLVVISVIHVLVTLFGFLSLRHELVKSRKQSESENDEILTRLDPVMIYFKRENEKYADTNGGFTDDGNIQTEVVEEIKEIVNPPETLIPEEA